MINRVASLLTITVLLCNPSAVVSRIRMKETSKNSIAKELKIAEAGGATKDELIKKKAELQDKQRTARAAGISFDTIIEATEKGTKLDDIKATIMEHNLMKFKNKGVFKKSETDLSAILFPGASPEEYKIGSDLDMILDTVESRQNVGLPLLYYDLPVCVPDDTTVNDRRRKNLGERLAGKAVPELTPYKLKVLENTGCQKLCDEFFRSRDVNNMIKLIKMQYRVNVSLDSLPIQVKGRSGGTVVRGYPLGARLIDEASDTTEFVYHNHIRFVIMFNEDEATEGSVRVVGFSAVPTSINHDTENIANTCTPGKPVLNQKETLLYLNKSGMKGNLKDVPITYSYEVIWQRSEVPWTDRWDIYLLGTIDDKSAHHMSIVNSIMTVIILGSIVAIILIRSLRRDILLYNDLDYIEMEDEKDETGWKLIHGDVFRPPSTCPMFLAVMVGSGFQIAVSIFLTLLMSQTHMINPMMKGRALSNIVLTYVFSGTISGYVSARIFKFSGEKNWKLNTLYTAAFFPGIILGLFLCLNVFLTAYGSAKSIRVFTIVAAFFLWLCVASPLVFLGSFIGFKCDRISVPTRTNQIARVVPFAGTFLSHPIASLLIGAAPFSTICIEMYFLMGAIWLHHYYFLMGYLFIITILVSMTCSLMSIVMCYIRLCAEDHRWWWKSFCDSASCGFWLFLYSIWFVTFRLHMNGVMAMIVYFTYMTMISIAVALYCGAVSFISTLWFIKTIYSTVKLD